MVFKKRALGFSANISWLFSKALFALQQHVYSQKRKTFITGHFGTINSYNGNPVLAYRFFQTLCSPLEENAFSDELIHNGFWLE